MEIGEVVQLKSGGPEMTIESIRGEWADCTWAADSGIVMREAFALATLLPKTQANATQ